MKKGDIQILLIVLLLVLTASNVHGENTPYIGPYLQDVTGDSIGIMWVTNGSETSKVEYTNETFTGSNGNNYHQCIAVPRTACFHRVNLTGLKPDSSYSYRVHFNDYLDLWTDNFTFHTAPDANASVRIVVYGDSRLNSSNSTDATIQSEVVKQIINHKPEIVIHVGDFALNGKCYDQWVPQFFSPTAPLMHNISFFTAIGNHEVVNLACTEFSTILYDYFFPQKQWYAFTYGDARFIFLKIQSEHYNINKYPDQLDWLKKELNSSEYLASNWHFVFFHSSVYTNDINHTNNLIVINQLVPLFQSSGVDIVFSGHSHSYERSSKEGMYYIVTGGGGADISKFWDNTSNNSFSQVRILDYNHVTLDVTPENVKLNTWYNNGSILDHLEIQSFEGIRNQTLIQDTYISEKYPNNNYGNTKKLKVIGHDPLIQNQSMLIKWEVSSIQPGSKIRSASIIFNTINPTNGTYNIYELKRDWKESEATWNNASIGNLWQVPGAMGVNDRGNRSLGTVTPKTTGTYKINLNSFGLDLIQKWIDDPSMNYGIKISNVTEKDGAQFNSSEDQIINMRPKLLLKYVIQ
jgi:predicted phosphodiesterase